MCNYKISNIGIFLSVVLCFGPILFPIQSTWAQQIHWKWVEDPFVLNPGGINEKEIHSLSFADLDRDGDPDLAIRSASGLEFYQNQGHLARPRWVKIEGFFDTMGEDTGSGIALVDLDGDGVPNPVTTHKDLFESPTTLVYWQNLGTYEKPDWVKAPEMFGNVSLEPTQISPVPGFADIDRDGDLDFVIGNGSSFGNGRQPTLYENIGTDENPFWKEDTTAFADIYDNPPGYDWWSPQLADINGDGYTDLFLVIRSEDLFWFNIYEGKKDSLGYHWMRNWELTGWKLAPYPGGILEIQLVDIDSDGDHDLVSLSASRGIRLYENRGDSSEMVFSDEYIRLDAIKVPGPGIPLLFDYDPDGYPDLLVSGSTWSWAADFTGLYEAYHNVSGFGERGWLGNQWINCRLYSYGMINCRTSLVDLNGDENPDLIIGGYRYYSNRSRILFFQNEGEASNPVWKQNDSIFADFNNSDTLFLDPSFGDPDGDGDFDLLIRMGKSYQFYENTGGSRDSLWVLNPTWRQGIEDSAYCRGVLADLDRDNDLDLVFGSCYDDELICYENRGDPFTPVWHKNESVFAGIDLGAGAAPSFGDLDRDGDLDLIVGTGEGKFLYFENCSRVNVETETRAALPREFALFQNYPNPFNAETSIRYQLPVCSYVTLKIFNLQGQQVKIVVDSQQASGYHAVKWDGKNANGFDVTSGVYFCRMEAGGSHKEFIRIMKLLILR